MLILTHIVIALSSVAFSGFTFLRPSHRKLRIATTLIVATVATGSYLVVLTHSSMLSVCMMGLFYIGGSLVALLATKHRLAQQNAMNNLD